MFRILNCKEIEDKYGMKLFMFYFFHYDASKWQKKRMKSKNIAKCLIVLKGKNKFFQIIQC